MEEETRHSQLLVLEHQICRQNIPHSDCDDPRDTDIRHEYLRWAGSVAALQVVHSWSTEVALPLQSEAKTGAKRC